MRSGPGIERNQVDLRRDALQQFDELSRVTERIVDALQHDVFEGDPPRVRQTRVVAARLHQFGQRIFAVERHQCIAQFVVHSMQGDRQHDANLGAGANDVRHHARGRERDAPARDADTFIVGHDRQLAPDKRVQQRGLPCVRTTDERYEAEFHTVLDDFSSTSSVSSTTSSFIMWFINDRFRLIGFVYRIT